MQPQSYLQPVCERTRPQQRLAAAVPLPGRPVIQHATGSSTAPHTATPSSATSRYQYRGPVSPGAVSSNERFLRLVSEKSERHVLTVLTVSSNGLILVISETPFIETTRGEHHGVSWIPTSQHR